MKLGTAKEDNILLCVLQGRRSVCRKPLNFSSILSNDVVKTVRVQSHAIQFSWMESDIRTFELRIMVWRNRDQYRWLTFLWFFADWNKTILVRIATVQEVNRNIVCKQSIWTRFPLGIEKLIVSSIITICMKLPWFRHTNSPQLFCNCPIPDLFFGGKSAEGWKVVVTSLLLVGWKRMTTVVKWMKILTN